MNSILESPRGVKSFYENAFDHLREDSFKTHKLFSIRSSLFTNLAFTLAETLIVMGIIGVVAALTLPNLNSSTNNKEKVVKVKKIYQNLNDAFGRAQAIYGPSEEWGVNKTSNEKAEIFGSRITEFMKISKFCGTNTGCFKNETIKGLYSGSGFNPETSNTPKYKFITADGTSIVINSYSVYFDIDGPNKGNNQYGRDIFYFGINNNEITRGCPTEGTFSALLGYLKGTAVYAGCWILEYDNADYLQLINGKCPNGTTPTESNPRCN